MKSKLWLIEAGVILLLLLGGYITYFKITHSMKTTAEKLVLLEGEIVQKNEKIGTLENQIILARELAEEDRERARRTEKKLREIQAATKKKLDAASNEITVLEQATIDPVEADKTIGRTINKGFSDINQASIDIFPVAE